MYNVEKKKKTENLKQNETKRYLPQQTKNIIIRRIHKKKKRNHTKKGLNYSEFSTQQTKKNK